jgi:hypothetical protein
MGAWNYFCDGQDAVADRWHGLVSNLNLKILNKYEQAFWLRRHPVILYTKTFQEITEIKNSSSHLEPESVIVGLVLCLVKFLTVELDAAADFLDWKTPGDWSLPQSLPDAFSQDLYAIARECIQTMIQNNNKIGLWKDWQLRHDALEQELKLFLKSSPTPNPNPNSSGVEETR